jgi:hypothetical protein
MVQLTRRAVLQEGAGTATTVTSWPTARSRRGRRYRSNSAALRFMPDEDLQAEAYGAYWKVLNQATTTQGAKR